MYDPSQRSATSQTVPRTVAAAKRPFVRKRPCPLPQSFPSTFCCCFLPGLHAVFDGACRTICVGFAGSELWTTLNSPPVTTADASCVTIWTLPAVASTTAPGLIWSAAVSGWLSTWTFPASRIVLSVCPGTGGGRGGGGGGVSGRKRGDGTGGGMIF